MRLFSCATCGCSHTLQEHGLQHLLVPPSQGSVNERHSWTVGHHDDTNVSWTLRLLRILFTTRGQEMICWMPQWNEEGEGNRFATNLLLHSLLPPWRHDTLRFKISFSKAIPLLKDDSGVEKKGPAPLCLLWKLQSTVPVSSVTCTVEQQ